MKVNNQKDSRAEEVPEYNTVSKGIIALSNKIWSAGNSFGVVKEGNSFLPASVVYGAGLLVEGLIRRLK